MRFFQLIKFSGILSALFFSAVRADMISVTDDSVKAGGTFHWTNSNSYYLHGKVFIRAGSRLNIDSGTTIYADNNSGAATTILVICRGARIYAQGTAGMPITFTSILDTSKILLPIGNISRGLWGGLQICGRATNNAAGGINLKLTEDATLTDSTLLWFGDSVADDNDTSGVLEYVSVRYTGQTDIGQIKGFVLASVGKGTIVDHVEAFCGAEDGFDLYGGTVDVKYVTSEYNAGDDIYYSYGYSGRVQFAFAIQTVIPGGKSNGTCSKLESSDSADMPYSTGKIYNATYIGTGANNPDTWKYKYGIYYKKDAGGTFANSILTQCSNYGIYVDSTVYPNTSARAHLADSTLIIMNNIFYGFGHGNTLDSVAANSGSLEDYLTSHNNDLSDPMINAFGWPSPADSLTLKSDSALDPRPSPSGIATQNIATTPNDGFFENVNYRGAFDPNTTVWLKGWSTLARFGMLKPAATSPIKIPSKGLAFTSSARLFADGDLFTLEWNQLSAGRTVVTLRDMSGRQIGVLDNSQRRVGMQTIPVALKAPGVYVLHIVQPGHTESLRVSQAR